MINMKKIIFVYNIVGIVGRKNRFCVTSTLTYIVWAVFVYRYLPYILHIKSGKFSVQNFLDFLFILDKSESKSEIMSLSDF